MSPRWSPDKEPCPRDLTVEERRRLFEASVPVAPADPHSRRFVVRRTARGIEAYDIKWTRDVDGEPEFHGHPASRIPRDVLKQLRDRGELTTAEYRRLARELPGC